MICIQDIVIYSCLSNFMQVGGLGIHESVGRGATRPLKRIHSKLRGPAGGAVEVPISNVNISRSITPNTNLNTDLKR
jgi:hypothetical protein